MYRDRLSSALLAACMLTAWAAGQQPSVPADSQEKIAQLIDELNNPSFERRTAATRQLCALGMEAYGPLEQAVRSGDAETAMRAQVVLKVLERVLFSGVEIELTFSRPAIAWNDSVDLIIEMVNGTAFPARVPFLLPEGERDAIDPEARQVGDLHDAADWLSVRGPGGEPVRLHMDDFTPESAVAEEIDRRIESDLTSILGPGERVRLRLEQFNRGWARYRLLEEGVYRVVFDYEPPWTDPVLRQRRVGRVVSNEAELRVDRGAPPAVARGGDEAELILEQEQTDLVVKFLNRSDLPVTLNANFGTVAPFARGSWRWRRGQEVIELPHLPAESGAALDGFRADQLREVEAGSETELLRIGLPELVAQLRVAGAPVNESGWEVAFEYTNPATRRWQEQASSVLTSETAVPAVLKAPLPRRMADTRELSNSLSSPVAGAK